MPIQMKPGLIPTTKGEMSEADLRRVDGAVDNANEFTEWVEFYLGEELVHRSVVVSLKSNTETQPFVGTL